LAYVYDLLTFNDIVVLFSTTHSRDVATCQNIGLCQVFGYILHWKRNVLTWEKEIKIALLHFKLRI